MVAEDTQSARFSYLADFDELVAPLVLAYLGCYLFEDVRSVILEVSVVVVAL